MTSKESKEILPQVLLRKDRTPAEAQMAVRTPDMTSRFMNRKRLQKASPLTTGSRSHTRRGLRGVSQPKATPRGDNIKNVFAVSRPAGDNKADAGVQPSIDALPYAPSVQPEMKSRALVKPRQDVYDMELDDDESGYTIVPAQNVPVVSGYNHPGTNTLLVEPRTSSFNFPDTSPGSQESRTLTDCLRVSRNAQVIESSREQGEELTELDLEILHLGQDQSELPPASRSPFGSSKRSRSPVEHEAEHDFALYGYDSGGEGDGDSESRLPNKRRRTSRRLPSVEARTAALQELNDRQTSKKARNTAANTAKQGKSRKQKKKRRLPVDELVTVSERLGDSEVDGTNSQSAELSQDPIVLDSDNEASDASETEHYRSSPTLKIHYRPRKRKNTINISLFRMPELRHHKSSRPKWQLTPSYSDGFEGDEAAPIGHFMPLKRPARQRETYQGITIKFGQLTIVAEKPTEDEQVEQRRSNKRKPRVGAILDAHSDADIVTNDMEQHETIDQASNLDRQVEHDETTPKVLTSEGDIETPAHLVSPLKHKQSAIQCTTSARDNSQEQPEHTIRGKIDAATPTESRFSQQLLLLSAKNKSQNLTTKSRARGLDIAHELMLVSVQKDARGSDSGETSSDDEGDSDSFAESEDENVSAEDENTGESLVPEEPEYVDGTNDKVPEHLVRDVKDIRPGKGSTKDTDTTPKDSLKEQSPHVLEHVDSSWRPRVPDTSGLAMETDEEIQESPTPEPFQNRQHARRRSSRRHSVFANHRLALGNSYGAIVLPEAVIGGLNNTQGSVELGDHVIRHPTATTIPETQFENPREIPETQEFIVPEFGYIERASRRFSQPIPRSSISRTKSIPAFAQQMLPPIGDTLMAGDVTMSAAFQHTVSPVKIPSRTPSLLHQPSSQGSSLRSLTRQASLSMGTKPGSAISGSARKRMPSLLLKPPFKRPEDGKIKK